MTVSVSWNGNQALIAALVGLPGRMVGLAAPEEQQMIRYPIRKGEGIPFVARTRRPIII